MTPAERKEKFLAELSALSRKHNMIIELDGNYIAVGDFDFAKDPYGTPYAGYIDDEGFGLLWVSNVEEAETGMA